MSIVFRRILHTLTCSNKILFTCNLLSCFAICRARNVNNEPTWFGCLRNRKRYGGNEKLDVQSAINKAAIISSVRYTNRLWAIRGRGITKLQTKVPCLPPSATVPFKPHSNLSVDSEKSLISASDKKMEEVNTNASYFED